MAVYLLRFCEHFRYKKTEINVKILKQGLIEDFAESDYRLQQAAISLAIFRLLVRSVFISAIPIIH